MKNSAELVLTLLLAAASGPACAKTGPVNYALEHAISANGAAAVVHAPAVPAPAIEQIDMRAFRFKDITDKCTHNGEVVSSFPAIYSKIQNEENSRILRVFLIVDEKGDERRVEVYFTGGDWMKYGIVYFVTNAGQPADRVSAYLMADLSTPDHEDGAVPPKINPLDFKKLAMYTVSSFLEENGSVKPAFTGAPVASVSLK